MHEADTSLAGGDEAAAGSGAAGKMEGFRFIPAQGSALPAAAAEDEYALQAERFAAAPNADFAVSQDGAVRWRGQPVAKLKAGEDILRPQAVLLADAALCGAAREKAEARLIRFVNFHFETVCKPLYNLAAAEALFAQPRLVAEKIVAHLGIVPRHEIAAQVKELERESRAALRRLGVRFGVYHIFMPMLLKPAAARGLTLLWALKHDAIERPGYGDVIACLAAGRTSFAADERFDRRFYRLAGYRLLGNKAVRIDMLERCADLIRQALAWSPETADKAASRPEGAYDGRCFTVTPAMFSILGATPEDMEDMLKQLGYAARSVSAAEYAAVLSQAGRGGGEEALPAEGRAEAETQGAVPAAEPVGPKFSGRKASRPAGDGPVLLWRYQKRSHKRPPPRARRAEPGAGGNEARGGHNNARPHGQDAARKEGERRFGRAGKNGEDGRQAGGKFAGGKAESGKPRHFAGKKHDKPMRAEDSPFAALLALRDKMKK